MTPGVRIKGLKKMLLRAMGGGKWGLGQEPREGAMELSVSGPLRCPLRPPPPPPPLSPPLPPPAPAGHPAAPPPSPRLLTLI